MSIGKLQINFPLLTECIESNLKNCVVRCMLVGSDDCYAQPCVQSSNKRESRQPPGIVMSCKEGWSQFLCWIARNTKT